MTKIDFHLHSTASDGLLSPTQVVERAYNNNVKYIALTDHDTTSGIQEAKERASSLNINLIPGIELSTDYNKESIHILGFFKDDSFNSPELNEYFHTLKNKRRIRALEMVKKLKEECNIIINGENVLRRGKDVVARPHIAHEIISSGYPYTMNEIFEKFIGKDCPAYVPTTKLSTEDGVKLLKKYNALVFLAHPILIKNSTLDDFLPMGFDGIEAVYFQNSKEDEKRLINFALDNKLLISAGSDCHGDFKDDFRHGDIGCMNLNEHYLEKFLCKYNS